MNASESQTTAKTATQTKLAERRQTVSFSPNALVRETIHHADYTDEEIAVCWYDTVELKMIKVDIKTTTLLLMNSDYLSLNINDGRCSRGLESYTEKGQALKMKHREAAIDAVLDEQDFQFEEGNTDPEMIADAYFEKTRRSQAMARVMGVSDQETVRNQEEQQKPLVVQRKVATHEKLSKARGSIDMLDQSGSSGRRLNISCHAA
jgi:hypothetical protein